MQLTILTFVAALAGAAAPVTAAPVTAAPTPIGEPAPMKLQDKFNAANALAMAYNCREAVPALEQLEQDGRIKSGSFPAATIAVRKGTCLVATGRNDEGERSIAIGLPALIAAGPEFAGDVSDARRALGDVRNARSDRDGAARYYRLALEGKAGSARLALLARLTRALAFDGNEAALVPVREALAMIKADPETDKALTASFQTLYARTMLNQGRSEEAYTELKQALALSGGLTLKTSIDEVSLRGDLAMAAMLLGRKEAARNYLAYTGAGRIGDIPFARARVMDLPLCGAETGLRPEDVAVVEFGINDDGTIMYAQTVYSRGGPQVAAAFEHAVRDWYWSREDAGKIPTFYRLAPRVELRCTNRLGVGPGLMSPLTGRFAQWARSILPTEVTNLDGSDRMAALRRLAHDETGATEPTARIAALGMILAINPYEPETSAAKAIQLAGKATVPIETVNWLRVAYAMNTGYSAGRKNERRQALAQLAVDPAIAADPLASGTLLLEAAGNRTTRRDPQSDAWVTQVAQDARLPDNHPLRQIGWLALANRAAGSGDLVQAQANFAKTGLTEEQCALLSVPPAMRSANTSGRYPMAAAAMGFEGWVRLEYDIKANGSTVNVRPTVAYPPLIFVEAATEIGKIVKHDTSYRPGQSTACSANTEAVVFAL